MDNDVENMCEFDRNLDHIKFYIPENPNFLCFGSELDWNIRYLKSYHKKDFKNSEIEVVLSLKDFLTSSFHDKTIKEIRFTNIVHISSIRTDPLFRIIRYISCLFPEIIIIDKDKYGYSINELYDTINSVDITNYILEVNNSQYVLVRRDCYSKKI